MKGVQLASGGDETSRYVPRRITRSIRPPGGVGWRPEVLQKRRRSSSIDSSATTRFSDLAVYNTHERNKRAEHKRIVSLLGLRSTKSRGELMLASPLPCPELRAPSPAAEATNMTKAREKLMRGIRKARNIVRFLLRVKYFSQKSSEKTFAAELYFNTLSSDQHEYGNIAFNKNHFCRKYNLSVPAPVQEIATQEPMTRTEEQVEQLRRCMCRIHTFQERFTKDMQLRLARMAFYLGTGPGRTILRQGHEGHYFYFVFSGSVVVQYVAVDPKTGTASTYTENVISAGESFGELALLGVKTRTATIMTRERSEFFFIEKETFDSIFPGIFDRELSIKLNACRSQPFFKELPASACKKVCFMSHLQEYPTGRVLEKSWSGSTNIYVVVKGRIGLYQEINLREMEKLYDIRLPGMMEHALNAPRVKLAPVTSRKVCTDGLKCFCRIGELREGQMSDLGILSERINLRPIVLVSEGCTAVRIIRKYIQWTVPETVISDFIRNRYKPVPLPSDGEVFVCYLAQLNWDIFKTRVRTSVTSRENTRPAAHVPSHMKGCSGWARWPGQQERRPKTAPAVPQRRLIDNCDYSWKTESIRNLELVESLEKFRRKPSVDMRFAEEAEKLARTLSTGDEEEELCDSSSAVTSSRSSHSGMPFGSNERQFRGDKLELEALSDSQIRLKH